MIVAVFLFYFLSFVCITSIKRLLSPADSKTLSISLIYVCGFIPKLNISCLSLNLVLRQSKHNEPVYSNIIRYVIRPNRK